MTGNREIMRPQGSSAAADEARGTQFSIKIEIWATGRPSRQYLILDPRAFLVIDIAALPIPVDLCPPRVLDSLYLADSSSVVSQKFAEEQLQILRLVAAATRSG